MKVLVTSHLYPSPLSQTSGIFVHNQVRFLQEHGRIQVVNPTPFFPLPGFGRWSAHRHLPRCSVMDGVQVQRPRYITLPRRIAFSWVWRSYLRALERANIDRPDVVHAHVAYPDGLAAVAYGRRRGVPVVLTVHGQDIKILPQAKPRWRRRVQEALSGAAAVIAVSRQMRDLVIELGCSADKVRLIPNGVDCQIFTGDLARDPGRDGWRLLYVGRLDPAKGISVLLQALGLLDRRDWSLTLVGGDPTSGMLERFRAEVREQHLEEQVHFFDEMPWTEVPHMMAAADLFVLPSFSEGLPGVLLEAMASGLPILSTRCGGPEELVDADVGQLVAVGDAQALAGGLGDMLDNYRLYDRTAIRQRALERYDYRPLAARISQVYAEVLPPSSTPPP